MQVRRGLTTMNGRQPWGNASRDWSGSFTGGSQHSLRQTAVQKLTHPKLECPGGPGFWRQITIADCSVEAQYFGMGAAGPLQPLSGVKFGFDDLPALEISSAQQLREALRELSSLEERRTVILTRRLNHYVQAMRHGDRWSVALREGRFWTCRSFDASATAEFSEYEVPTREKALTFWERITGWTPGEIAITTAQVEEIFMAYLLDTDFPLPFSD